MNGVSVVITRARDQASELAAKLLAAGASVIELPLIELRDPPDWGPVDDAVSRIHSFDWILFTSANAVKFLATRMAGHDLAAIPARVCCIGPKTRSVAEQAGWRVALVPREYVAESVAASFEGESLASCKFLLPRAAVARDLVPDALRQRGATVEIVEVYRNAVPEDAPARAAAVLQASPRPDWIAFTSSSTVKNLLAVASRDLLTGIRLASIGPATSETVQKHGLIVDAEADPHTLDGLVEAIGRSIIRPVS